MLRSQVLYMLARDESQRLTAVHRRVCNYSKHGPRHSQQNHSWQPTCYPFNHYVWNLNLSPWGNEWGSCINVIIVLLNRTRSSKNYLYKMETVVQKVVICDWIQRVGINWHEVGTVACWVAVCTVTSSQPCSTVHMGQLTAHMTTLSGQFGYVKL